MKNTAPKENAPQAMTAGGALLTRLKAVGVDYIFANSGTDFPPVIEGLAEAQAHGLDLPKALVMPHEAAAMGMAHGYYLASGRAQAVMAHTNVGLANCAIGAINAATEQVPMLLFSGRTPSVETGRLGARTVPISWGQEMRDQHALIREACKWDYELRFPEQVAEVVDRAMALACSDPPGPVYVSLPREVLCEQVQLSDLDALPRHAPANAAPHPDALAQAATLLAGAKNPVIFAQRGAGDSAGAQALAQLATDWAIPVVQWWVVQAAIGTEHPMNVGANPEPWVAQADVILSIDCLAPWSPETHRPKPDCQIIQLGRDPLYARFPVRNFHADVTLTGGVSEGIRAIADAMAPARAAAQSTIDLRRDTVERAARDRRDMIRARAQSGNGAPMTKDFVADCLSTALQSRDAAILSELGCPLEAMRLDERHHWYQEPHSGGLGWSFPAALGMKLARPERTVVATMGDGSYLFSNPAACHQIAEAMGLGILLIVLNNSEWGAVRDSVVSIYPDGYAARANSMPLTSLNPTPDFAAIARASRAWATTVDNGADLPTALQRALDHIDQTGTHALIEATIRS